MKNWMINTSGDIVLIIRSGDKVRNQSLIRVAGISKKKIVRYRSNRIPRWIIEEALDVLNMDHNVNSIYEALRNLKVGDDALLQKE